MAGIDRRIAMTPVSRETHLRKAMEEEGGMPVSAGARVAHVRLAVASGRALTVDLSGVPENQRVSIIAEIKAIVDRASSQGRVDPAATSDARTRE
jgi:hypothetical protein